MSESRGTAAAAIDSWTRTASVALQVAGADVLPLRMIAAGIDHRWENTVQLTGEYLFHGTGETSPKRYLDLLAGRFDPDELNELIVGWSNDRPIYLNEVADVEIALVKK